MVQSEVELQVLVRVPANGAVGKAAPMAQAIKAALANTTALRESFAARGIMPAATVVQNGDVSAPTLVLPPHLVCGFSKDRWPAYRRIVADVEQFAWGGNHAWPNSREDMQAVAWGGADVAAVGGHFSVSPPYNDGYDIRSGGVKV